MKPSTLHLGLCSARIFANSVTTYYSNLNTGAFISSIEMPADLRAKSHCKARMFKDTLFAE